MEEFEIKFLEVDIPQLEKKLIEIGAKKAGEYFYKRRHFDYPDLRLDKNHEWIRVRDEGNRIVLTHKKRINPSQPIKDAVMNETEVEVDDFDKTCQILYAVGLEEKNYQENKRIRYKKADIEYDIDIWPKLPPYLEIEGKNIQSVEIAARELGFDPNEAVRYTAWHMYRDKGINLGDYQKITFDGFVKK